MASTEYTWVFRAPGERYVRSWILQRQGTEIRIRSGRAGREKETENYRVRSHQAASDRCGELRRQREAEGWILAASQRMEEGGYSREYSGVPVRGAVLSRPGDWHDLAHLLFPRKKRVVDLATAVRVGDAAAVKAYLEGGADPDEVYDRSVSMLTLAAYHDHLEVMDLLLDAGASLSPAGLPPLETAASRGHEYAVSRLVEAGAAPEAMSAALHAALSQWRPKVARLLIELGADVNAPDSSGFRPLDYALARGDHAMTQTLVERGARVSGAAAASTTAVQSFRMDDLAKAIDAGDVDRVRLIIGEGVLSEPKWSTPLSPNPVAWAAEAGHVEIVRLLLEAGAQPAGGAVHAAARNNHLEVAKVLLKAGGSVEDPDEEGTTALISATYAGFPDMVRLLVEHGADVDHRDRDGDAALIQAAHRGHGEIYRLLLPLTRDAGIRAEAAKHLRRRRRWRTG